MNSYFFELDNIQSINALRTVKTVRSSTGESSDGKLLTLYMIDTSGTKSVVRLVDGNRVGLDTAYVVHHDNLEQLPVVPHPGLDRKTRYELVFDENVDRTKTIYQLFVGNMYEITPDMTQFFSNADDVLLGFSAAIKKNPKAPHAYLLKYQYGKEVQYIPLSCSEI